MSSQPPCVIFHFDLDSFFVSAERLERPELIGKACAVGGTAGRGVISAASYEARKKGVRSAQPVVQSLRLCPELILVPPNFSLYERLSKQVFSILENYSPRVEATGIDEGYLDMTGSEKLWGKPLEAAAKIRKEIFEKTKLPSSIGIGANRMIAKIATDFGKPNGMKEVPAGTEKEFLAPLPVKVIPGCGPKTESWLHARGIFRIHDLQSRSKDWLIQELGSTGEWLHRASLGQGSTEFFAEAQSRSISRETTFDKDLRSVEAVEKVIWEMSKELALSLREENLWPKTLKVKLRYPPFETFFRARKPEFPARTDSDLFNGFRKLIFESWDPEKALRLIGVGCEVTEESSYQYNLFSQPTEELKKEKIDQLKDRIQKKFGDGVIKTGKDFK